MLTEQPAQDSGRSIHRLRQVAHWTAPLCLGTPPHTSSLPRAVPGSSGQGGKPQGHCQAPPRAAGSQSTHSTGWQKKWKRTHAHVRHTPFPRWVPQTHRCLYHLVHTTAQNLSRESILNSSCSRTASVDSTAQHRTGQDETGSAHRGCLLADVQPKVRKQAVPHLWRRRSSVQLDRHLALGASGRVPSSTAWSLGGQPAPWLPAEAMTVPMSTAVCGLFRNFPKSKAERKPPPKSPLRTPSRTSRCPTQSPLSRKPGAHTQLCISKLPRPLPEPPSSGPHVLAPRPPAPNLHSTRHLRLQRGRVTQTGLAGTRRTRPRL